MGRLSPYKVRNKILQDGQQWLTEECENALLPTWDGDREAFEVFVLEMRLPMALAIEPELTIGQKLKLQLQVRADLWKFLMNFRKTDLYWEVMYGPNEGKPIGTFYEIYDRLAVPEEQQNIRAKRSSVYQDLAEAVGRAMAKSGLRVSSYYNSEYEPHKKGNAAQVIEICIAAARQRPTNNLKHLALIAGRAAKLASKKI